MGRILYGANERDIDVDDRTLAHVKIVILSKLRRGESFAFSWDNPVDSGGGRNTIWIDRAIQLEFVFFGSRPASLNRRWIQEMSNGASNGELRILPEPPDEFGGQSGNQGRF
jgi:hypothetical protein